MLNQKQQKLVGLEVKTMLQEGSILEVYYSKGEFLSSLFLVTKKFEGNGEGFALSGIYMCKIGLKDAYCSVLLHKDSQKVARFLWVENLYEFLCLCFGLGLAPRIFKKLLKFPVSVLRRVMIRDMTFLILVSTIDKVFMAWDSMIFLLEHLGFVINLKIYVLDPI